MSFVGATGGTRILARPATRVERAFVAPGRAGVPDSRTVTRTLLLALHITAVAAWLGANLVQIVLSPRLARSSREAAAAWTRQTIWLGQRYYPLAGALIAISGVLLVLESDWPWDSGFIWVGVAVVVIGAVMGVGVFNPLADRRTRALEAGDDPAAARALGRIVPLGMLDTGLILVAILAMVHKWGT